MWYGARQGCGDRDVGLAQRIDPELNPLESLALGLAYS